MPKLGSRTIDCKQLRSNETIVLKSRHKSLSRVQREQTHSNYKFSSRNSEFYRADKLNTLDIASFRDANSQSSLAFHSEQTEAIKAEIDKATNVENTN